MAIIEAVPHISVQILVNGTPVPEFDDEDNNNGNNHDVANSVSSYVEVTAGESFSIQSHMKPAFVPKHDLVVRIHVDGKYVDSHVIRAVEIVRSGGHTSTSNGIRESTNAGQFLRRFIFSGITTSGNDSRVVAASDDLNKTLKEIGTICVKLTWVEIKGHPAIRNTEASTFTKLGVIPEKALKGRALSTQTECGLQEAIPPFETVKVKNLYEKPFAEFSFKYRSRKDLKSLLIIPRSPSPVPLEDREVDSLSPEEMRQLLRRNNERRELAQKAKTERVVLKREPSTQQIHIAHNSGEDDDEVSFVSTSKRRKFAITVDANGSETIDLT